jgi:hypothetical protein
VIDAVFGAESEQVLAGQLLTALRPGMLLLGDRNFASWKLWGQSAATGAQLLWRPKAGLLLPRIGVFPDGSWLAVLPKPGTGRRVGHWVRVIEYTVTVTATHPGTGEVTTRTELFRLLTTITDPTMASAADLAGCYRQRWESETGYKAIKTCQRGPRTVLRSTDPDGVRQELYAYLITYQAIRALMHHAAVIDGTDPDRLSFTTALRAVRRWISTATTTTPPRHRSRRRPRRDQPGPQPPPRTHQPSRRKTLPSALPSQTPRSTTSIHQRRIRHHRHPENPA